MYNRPSGLPEPKPPKLHQFPVLDDPPICADEDHVPNHFSVRERIGNLVLALTLLAYGLLSLSIDDMYLPGKYTSGIHLHGAAAWLMFGALLSSAAVLIALVIDHYDRRNNERRYVWFKRGASVAGWSFFSAALIWDFWRSFQA